MPLKRFICPDSEEIEITECLNKCRRPEGRCLSLPTLVEVFQSSRAWSGVPSTTQLLNGTLLAYLEITEDYPVDPRNRAFSLLGTRHHKRLEIVAKRLSEMSEKSVGAGVLDLLTLDETSPDKGQYELWDYKTSGSFKVAKALGIVGEEIPDPSGEVYMKTTRYHKSGEPKTITIWKRDENAIDMWEWEMQLNDYRIKAEALGFPVSKMKIQDTVRDGGTYVATNRGILENIYLIPVKRLDDDFVKKYFERKRVALLNALALKQMPSPCDAKESWEGRRCVKKYCDVFDFCPKAKTK